MLEVTSLVKTLSSTEAGQHGRPTATIKNLIPFFFRLLLLEVLRTGENQYLAAFK